MMSGKVSYQHSAVQNILTLFLFIILCSDAYDTCEQTTQCRYGHQYCNNDRCIYGCKPGWVGNLCNEPCYINHCLECISSKPGETGLQNCTLCEPGYYGHSCENVCSENCLFGSHRCSREGHCLYGCKPNFQGLKCETQFCDIPNCRLCKTVYGHHYCHVCEDGMSWSQQFQRCIECTGHCVGGSNTCNTTTGICPKGCENGWYGSNCDLNCTIPNCLKCKEYGYLRSAVCDYCEDGWYKSEGKCTPCSSACMGGNYSCNHDTGHCKDGCILGWYGKACTKKCTLPYCKICAETVFSVTYCSECEKGWYWHYSDSTCIRCTANCSGGPQECNPSNGQCLYGCAEGYYGSHCEWTCSKHCVNGSCNSDSGECNYGCTEGWYGSRCDSSCPIHCLQCSLFINGICAECEAGTYGVQCEQKCSTYCEKSDYNGYIYCDKDSGSCINGCVGGYYGETCNNTCSDNCYNRICDRTSGHCTTGCQNAWYGDLCDKRCPKNCKSPSSAVSRQCHPASGHCMIGCITGYYGNVCDEKCSANCLFGDCDQKTGLCIHGCENGFYGFNCIKNCSANCDNDTCFQYNGVCKQCYSGFYGEYCKYECFQNCLNECDKISGFCDSCKPGFYGDRCTEDCVNCFNGTCNQRTGVCTNGCVEGMTGAECIYSCTPGYYGRSCGEKCGHCKDSNPCNHRTGECQLGCDVGWIGATCQVLVQAATGSKVEEDNSNTIAVVGSVVAAILFIAIVIIIVVVFVRNGRRFRLCTKKRSHSQQSNHTVNQMQVIQTPSSNNRTVYPPICKERTIDQSELQLGHNLVNSGNFFQLSFAKLSLNNTECPVIVKHIVDRDNSYRLKKMFHNEIRILRTLPDHCNILNFIGISEINSNVLSVFKNNINNDLCQYLHNLRGSSAELPCIIVESCLKELVQLSLDVATGLAFLHEMKVLHRCLTSSSIFLDQNFTAKIGNFYFSEICNNDDETCTKNPENIGDCFTGWMAPEFLKNNISSCECDIWSFGILMWEVITLGEIPFERHDTDTLITRIIEGEKLQIPDGCNKKLLRIISRCWFDSPSQRPSAKQLVNDLNRLLAYTDLCGNDITVTTVV